MEEIEDRPGIDDVPQWDTGTLSDVVKDFLAEGGDAARAYLRESWLASTMQLLRDARRRAGLTQQQIADELNTSQPAIARLERGNDTTLGRFWDYLFACGEAPGEIETVQAEVLRRFVRENPRAASPASAVRQWSLREAVSKRTHGRALLWAGDIHHEPARDLLVARFASDAWTYAIKRSFAALQTGGFDQVRLRYQDFTQTQALPSVANIREPGGELGESQVPLPQHEQPTANLEKLAHASSTAQQGTIAQRTAA